MCSALPLAWHSSWVGWQEATQLGRGRSNQWQLHQHRLAQVPRLREAPSYVHPLKEEIQPMERIHLAGKLVTCPRAAQQFERLPCQPQQ